MFCPELGNTYSSCNQQIHLGGLREGLGRSGRGLRLGLFIIAPGHRRGVPVGAGVDRAAVLTNTEAVINLHIKGT